MNLREAAQQALEALEEMWQSDKAQSAITALRAVLAEPQTTHWQGCEEVHPECRKTEPVAWMQEMPVNGNEERSVRMTTVKMVADEWDNPIPLYTAPTPRQWVGLTDEDVHGVIAQVLKTITGGSNTFTASANSVWTTIIQSVEAKIQEKNI